uniref:Uncharacterized protein n=1 Tax=Populus davidiana TaxID=266767 RepID=A0A6M2F417_9ROSI
MGSQNRSLIHDHSPQVFSSPSLLINVIILQLVSIILSPLIERLILQSISTCLLSPIPKRLFPEVEPFHPLLHEHVLFYDYLFQPFIKHIYSN